MEVSDIVKHIFTVPPKPLGTICIELNDCCPPDSSSAYRSLVTSEILMTMLIQGIDILFQLDSDSIGKISEDQLNLLRKYFQSFRYTINVRSGPLDEAPPVAKTPRNNLKDFCERVYDFEQGIWHEISFDNLENIQI